MKIFNFKLESKLDLHFDVKFNGESNGDSLKAQKPYLYPLYYMAFIDPAPYRHKNERIERQKDTNNHVSFLAGVTLCVLRLIISLIKVKLFCQSSTFQNDINFRPNILTTFKNKGKSYAIK